MTFDDMPTVTWRSINPIRLRSDNIMTFQPSEDEDYSLMESVCFENVANPGVVVLTALSSAVTVGPP